MLEQLSCPSWLTAGQTQSVMSRQFPTKQYPGMVCCAIDFLLLRPKDSEKFDLIFSILQQMQNRQAAGSCKPSMSCPEASARGCEKLGKHSVAFLNGAGAAGGDGACPANAGRQCPFKHAKSAAIPPDLHVQAKTFFVQTQRLKQSGMRKTWQPRACDHPYMHWALNLKPYVYDFDPFFTCFDPAAPAILDRPLPDRPISRFRSLMV